MDVHNLITCDFARDAYNSTTTAKFQEADKKHLVEV